MIEKLNILKKWVVKNIAVIVYLLTVILDLIYKFTQELDLTNNQLNTLK